MLLFAVCCHGVGWRYFISPFRFSRRFSFSLRPTLDIGSFMNSFLHFDLVLVGGCYWFAPEVCSCSGVGGCLLTPVVLWVCFCSFSLSFLFLFFRFGCVGGLFIRSSISLNSSGLCWWILSLRQWLPSHPSVSVAWSSLRFVRWLSSDPI